MIRKPVETDISRRSFRDPSPDGGRDGPTLGGHAAAGEPG